jgi:hypothetical protein
MTGLAFIALVSARRIASQINSEGVESIHPKMRRAALLWLTEAHWISMSAWDASMLDAVEALQAAGVTTAMPEPRAVSTAVRSELGRKAWIARRAKAKGAST